MNYLCYKRAYWMDTRSHNCASTILGKLNLCNKMCMQLKISIVDTARNICCKVDLFFRCKNPEDIKTHIIRQKFTDSRMRKKGSLKIRVSMSSIIGCKLSNLREMNLNCLVLHSNHRDNIPHSYSYPQHTKIHDNKINTHINLYN